MKSARKFLMRFMLIFSLMFSVSKPVRADLWGGDVVVLVKILANAIQQYQKLKAIVGNAKDSLRLAKDLNSGINEVLSLMETTFPESELGIYKDWKSLQDALKQMEQIYGVALDAKKFSHHAHLDQSVAEAMLLYNKLSKHSKRIDAIGESAKNRSQYASPKGAARLSAQVASIQLQVQNQSLRTQSALLKLQAQNSAIANKQQKDETRFFIKTADKLKEAMKTHDADFATPRF